MLRRMIERLMPWTRTRREALAAQEDAHRTGLEVAQRAGRTDQVVKSIRHRVYAENHISAAVAAAIKGDQR